MAGGLSLSLIISLFVNSTTRRDEDEGEEGEGDFL